MHLPRCKQTMVRMSTMQAQKVISPVKIILAEARYERLSELAERLEPMAEAACYVYIFQVVNKG